MFERLLVATDLSECATQALWVARRQFPAALRRLLSVEDLAVLSSADTQEADLQRNDQRWQAVQTDLQAGETVTRRVGWPATAIVQEALDWNADLIVLGTHGRQGLARALFGSVAEAVIRNAPVPVLVVRSAPVPARAEEADRTARLTPRPAEG